MVRMRITIENYYVGSAWLRKMWWQGEIPVAGNDALTVLKKS